MTLAQSARVSYRWLTITLLAAAGVYAAYAVSQYDRLNDLNQRELSNAGSEMKSALETSVETVRRFNRKWTDWKATNPQPGDPREPLVCDFDRSQPYLDLEECTDAVSWRNLPNVRVVATATLAIDATDGQPPGPQHPAVSLRFRTDKVLRELAFPDSFGLIFIATADGRIMYQEPPTQRRWLRHLRWGEQMFRDANADRPSGLQIQNLRETLGGDPAMWSKLRSSSSRISARVGGVAHQIYLQPLTLASGEGTDLLIGAAVPTNAIVREALALDTHFLGVLVFLLLFGLLGFPFVKLAFLDAHERFRLRDIILLYLSTGALLVLFTCASLALDGYRRWHLVADQGLESLAQELEARFIDEVTSIRDQLSDYDQQVSRMSIHDCERWRVAANWFKSPNADALPWPRRAIYLRQVAWIRPDGRQIWKSTSDAVEGKGSVDQRSYFRAVRDGHLFQIRGEGRSIFVGPDRSITDGKFYTFVSTPSEISPTFCPGAPAAAASVVAATAQLLSLDRQPLPTGYGFAVVTREGRVLYHSDRRLSLRENFFEELSEGSRARSMMYAGVARGLNSRYRERPHEFYLQPIGLSRAGERQLAGFYLVAFRDTSVERAVVAHVFLAGLVGPMVLLVGILALGLSAMVIAARYADARWSAWLWPHGGLNRVYKWQTIAFLGLLLAGIALWLITGDVAPFMWMPVLAAGLGIAIYVLGKPQAAPRCRLSARGWHTAAMVLLLVCMVIAPSAALFRLALNDGFAKMIWTERAWVEAQRSDVLGAAEVESVAENYAPTMTAERAAARRAYFSCMPAPYDVGFTPPGGPNISAPKGIVTVSDPGVQVELSAPRPDGAASSSGCASSFASDGRASDGSATRTPAGIEAIAIQGLHLLDTVMPVNETVVRQHFQEPNFAYSPQGTLPTPFGISGVALLGFSATIALLVWWVRWNTNRLFFADEETNPSTMMSAESCDGAWDACTLDERMILLQIARERIPNPHQRPIIRHLLDKNFLQLNPDLRPSSPAFEAFLLVKETELHAEVQSWEHVKVEHSWRYVRLILLASIGSLGFFLVVTQPGLQSGLIGTATGVTGALTTGLKLRDAATAFFQRRQGTA